jgi:GlpG protein
MRMIGHLPDEAQARLLSDFLLAKGVHNEIEHDGDGAWSLWVHEESQVAAAQSWFAAFRADPAAVGFREAAAEAERVRQAEARELEEYRRRIRTGRSLFLKFGAYGAGYLAYGLIIVCAAVSLFSQFGRDDTLLRHLFISYPGAGVAGFLPEVRAGEVWRLFTPMLIHFGVAHLLFNMLWLFQLGSMIEGRQGHALFALLVLGLAAGSNVAQYAIHGPGFGGMSGVVYGLFGYIWLRGKFDPASGLFVHPQTVTLMIIWFLACLTGWVGPVANVAHGAGLILGAGYGLLSAWWGRGRDR